MTFSYPDPQLTDGLVVLRRWSWDDLPCVEQASRDPYIPEWTTVPSSYTEQEGRAWIERQLARASDGEGLSLALADADSDKALGGVFLIARPQPGTVGIGYWLIESARGRGFASRSVRVLVRWALTDGELARVEALVEPDNVASQPVLEGVGFHHEGHLRSYLAFDDRRVDVLIYSLLPSDLG